MSLLRPAALIAAVIGAVGSVAMMLSVGERNRQILFLIILFVGWVASPFVALIVADIVGKRLSSLTRTTVHSLMLILALGSLAIYWSVVSSPPRVKPAAIFLMVPLASWLVMAIALSVAALLRRRRRLSHFVLFVSRISG